MAEPPGRAARPEAGSSVAPVGHYRGFLRPRPRNDHRTPATSNIPPNPPFGETPAVSIRGHADAASHAALRAPRLARRPDGALRRLGDARAVRGRHPRAPSR